MVRVDVAGRDRLDAEVLGEVAQEAEPPRVASLERPLELDEEALPAERPRQARRGVRVEEAEASSRAAGEADQPLVQLGHRSRAAPTAAAARGPRVRGDAFPRVRP